MMARFKIVKAVDSSLDFLSENVERHLSDGWDLHGELIAVSHATEIHYIQALVKYPHLLGRSDDIPS